MSSSSIFLLVNPFNIVQFYGLLLFTFWSSCKVHIRAKFSIFLCFEDSILTACETAVRNLLISFYVKSSYNLFYRKYLRYRWFSLQSAIFTTMKLKNTSKNLIGEKIILTHIRKRSFLNQNLIAGVKAACLFFLLCVCVCVCVCVWVHILI